MNYPVRVGKRWPVLAGIALALLACSDQPLGLDRSFRVRLLGTVPADSLRGGPADTLALTLEVVDQDGTPISGAVATFNVEGQGAQVLPVAGTTGTDGHLSVGWQLGTRSADRQQLEVAVRYGGGRETLVLTGTVIPTEVSLLSAPDSLALRLNTSTSLAVVATDPYGNAFVPETIGYSSSDSTVFVIDSNGVIQPRSRGVALAVATSGDHADTSSIHIFQVAGSIEVADSVRLHSLGQLAPLGFTVFSDSGNEIRDTIPELIIGDTTVARLAGVLGDSAVVVQAVGNGSTSLTMAIGSTQSVTVIDVHQVALSLSLTPASLPAFTALGDSGQLSAVAYDSVGVALISPIIVFSSGDSSVAQVSHDGWVRSTGNGATLVTAQELGGASASISVTVTQVADSLEVFWTDTASIVSAAQFAPPPLTCRSRDRNGFPLTQSPAVTNQTGTLFGVNCATLTVRASGYDTLTFSAGSLTRVLTSVVAVRPLPSSVTGAFVALDSFPFDYRLWAPSGRTNSRGETEIYVTGYQYVPDSNGVGPGALHRLVSHDGTSFQYDGIALDLLPPPCELICSGIENIAVVPRNDGPGWRMFFAAGSTGTYGWQVFSAVSVDERNWTIEPGVRITNGGPVPPAPAGVVPWPVGEGMVVDQLPGGEWRMLVGAYQRVASPPDRFEIVEYRSPDQLSWTYQGTSLTTSEVPSTAQRTIYSPSVVEITPGLWRMFFTGDDLNLAGGRSRIFSAVSQDRRHWKFESELLGAPGTDLYYSALVGNRLYFLRQDSGQHRRLAAVTLTMP